MLELARNAEVGENGHHHEQVINRKRFLQQVAGEEQEGIARTVGFINVRAEGKSQGNPENGPQCRAFHGDGLVLPVREQVDHQGDNHEHAKRDHVAYGIMSDHEAIPFYVKIDYFSDSNMRRYA